MEDEIRNALQDLGLEEDEIDREIEDYVSIEVKRNNLEDLYVGCAGFAQVGTDDYYEKQRFEAAFLRKYIFDKIGEPKEGSYLAWKSNPHDFGTYYDLHYFADESKASHMRYFEKLESLDLEELCPMIEQQYNFSNDKEKQSALLLCDEIINASVKFLLVSYYLFLFLSSVSSDCNRCIL